MELSFGRTILYHSVNVTNNERQILRNNGENQYKIKICSFAGIRSSFYTFGSEKRPYPSSFLGPIPLDLWQTRSPI